MQATVVTAFYPLSKSKHGVGKYHEWLRLFCAIPCNLVVFTDEASAALILEARGERPTHLVIRQFDSWQMTSPTMMEMWGRHHAWDPEQNIHSPELYAVWALKQECVMEAIRIDPFSSEYFVWCDIGIQRIPDMQQWYMSFPHPQICHRLCSGGQIAFLEVDPIPDVFAEAWKQRAPLPEAIPRVTLGGGCIAGNKAAWADFSEVYVRTLQKFDKRNIFAGKDQIVYVYMLLMHAVAKPYTLVLAKGFGHGGDRWMSFPVMLGGRAQLLIDGRFVPG
jgi:hypothetical protein